MHWLFPVTAGALYAEYSTHSTRVNPLMSYMLRLLPAKGLGERLKEIRESRGLNQGALADKMGKTQPELSRWEHGKVEANYDTVVMWAEALGVDVAEFMEEADRVAEPSRKYGGDGVDDLERAWLDELRRIGASKASPQQKMLDRDSLASVIARIAWARAEAAAAERARAVTAGDEAAQARAEAVRGRPAKEFERMERPQQPRKERKAG
jgi:transcriptional regulator with XRE-family HTH domain